MQCCTFTQITATVENDFCITEGSDCFIFLVAFLLVKMVN